MEINVLGFVIIIIQLVLYLITLKVCMKEIKILEEQNISILEANTVLSSLEKYNLQLLEKLSEDFCLDIEEETEDDSVNTESDNNLKKVLSEL